MIDAAATAPAPTAGLLPAQSLRRLVETGVISADAALAPGQVQPASLDLRLGRVAYRLRASFLPGPACVDDKLADLALHRIDLTGGAVLETGCVYIVPLLERVALPPDLSGRANAKSSTGRLDVFTRLVTDRGREFDTVPAGYAGPLYAEISPRSFPLLVRTGSRLNQLRLRTGHAELTDGELRALQARHPLVAGPADISRGLALSVDLDRAGPAGWKARRHAGLIDIDRVGAYDPADYWEPVVPRGQAIVLDPQEFYILASREAVSVPPEVAAEMVPYDPLVGEFRVHYAGFCDPGFGYSGTGVAGARAVLEVRCHEAPFMLEHGQVTCRLVFERLSETPDVLYGASGSNYQGQGLKLSKHFRAP